MTDNAMEIYNQGYYYYTGQNGYSLNYGKALECFQKAAELGVSDAMNYIGLFYENGELVPKNSELAFSWFCRAMQADKKNGYAAYNIARMLYSGIGAPKDMAKAYEWGKISVELGLGNTHSVYPQSCYLVGCILIEHFKNYKDAYLHFVDAAKYGGIAEAWYNLGWLSEKGVVPVKNSGNNAMASRDGMAREFYEEAAKKGMPEAMDAVGRLYIKYNMLKEARGYLEKAAAMGYAPAKKRLKMLNIAKGSWWNLF